MRYTVYCIGKDGIKTEVASASLLSKIKWETIRYLDHLGIHLKYRDLSSWTPNSNTKVAAKDITLIFESSSKF